MDIQKLINVWNSTMNSRDHMQSTYKQTKTFTKLVKNSQGSQFVKSKFILAPHHWKTIYMFISIFH